jgi:hypothetical protein
MTYFRLGRSKFKKQAKEIETTLYDK